MDIQNQWARVTAAASTAAAIATREQRTQLLQTALALGTSVTPDCVGASITLDTATGYATPAASSPLAMDLDLAQYADGDGPCIAACRDGHSYSIDIMGGDDIYPGFTAAADQHGVRSSLSLPVPAADRSALNLYASTTHAFDHNHAQARAALLARCIARFLPHPAAAADTPPPDQAQTRHQRDLLRQAQEHLMQEHDLSAGAAFARMTAASREHECGILAVATHVLNNSHDHATQTGEDARS